MSYNIVIMSEKEDKILETIVIVEKVKIFLQIVFTLFVHLLIIFGVIIKIVKISIGMFVLLMSILILIINRIRLIGYINK